MNSSTTLPIPYYTGQRYAALLALNLLELLEAALLNTPISVLNFVLILRTSVLHPNLKFILLAQSAMLFVRGIGRCILIPTRLATGDLSTLGNMFIFSLYNYPLIVRNFIVHMLVVERILATVASKCYERWRSAWFNVGWLTVISLLALTNSLMYTFLPKPIAMITSLAIYGVQFGLGLVEMFAFVWLWQHNAQRYRLDKFNQHDLSERYQLSENMRTARQLMPCLFLHFCNISLGGINTVFVLYVYDPADQFGTDFSVQLVFTIVTFNCFLIELTMILFHPFLKRDLLQCWNNLLSIWLNRNNNIIVPTNSNEKQQILMLKNIHGQPLIKEEGGRENAREEHFRQLDIVWGRVGRA